MPRARELGVPFDGEPGPLNAITDVAGVEVGYVTIDEGDGKLVVGQGPVRNRCDCHFAEGQGGRGTHLFSRVATRTTVTVR